MTVRHEVVRRWGQHRTHLAEIPEGLVLSARVFGADFEGVFEPIAAICGTVLQGRGTHVGAAKVIMQEGTAVTCPTCRYASSLETQ